MSHDRGTWFFDCDGVLLNSNSVKSTAFARVAQPFGAEAAERLVRHHVMQGGISRFDKLAWFFTEVLRREPDPGELEALLASFGRICSDELRGCAVEPHAEGLLTALANRGIRSHVVSGGLQEEVEEVLRHHGLAQWFASVNGSPRSKQRILHDLGAMGTGVFVGDSRYDMEVAAEYGLRRVFVTQWSEFADWQGYVGDHPDIIVVPDLGGVADIAASLDSPS